jgi:flagella basal body P-ring formation protein FlgA
MTSQLRIAALALAALVILPAPDYLHAAPVRGAQAASAAAPAPVSTQMSTQVPAQAQPPAEPVFSGDPVRVAVEQFLQRQLAGLPGKATVQVMPPSGGRAPECVLPEPFLPPGAPAWGRISVGVRCGGERPWTRYMQAQVSVQSVYYVAARAIAPGEAISPADMTQREGDLSTLPRAVVTDPAQLTGAVAANRIAAGSPLRTDLVRKAIAVRRGQNVNVTVEGDAFQVSSEGKVMADAAPGTTVQVQMRSGQMVNALVRSADTVVLQQ